MEKGTREKMKKIHEVKNVYFEDDDLCLDIDAKAYRFSIKDISKRLLKASKDERANFIISPSGYGIHWPIIDEDISIDGLLGIVHQPLKKAMNA